MGENGNDHGNSCETESDNVKDEDVSEIFGDCFRDVKRGDAENSVGILISSQYMGSSTF